MDNEPPPVKPWSQANKDYLQELVDTGKVDLERTSETKYIDSVRAKYFRDRDEANFCRNFITNPFKDSIKLERVNFKLSMSSSTV